MRPSEIVDGAIPLQHGLDLYNEQNPPDFKPPALLANYRHMCTKARQAVHTGKGVSTAIDLKEVYVTDWTVDEDGKVTPVINGEGELAIIFRQGSCKSCKQVARSTEGRIVETALRPPVSGRVGRD